MPDSSDSDDSRDKPTPAHDTLVVRAVFVPQGKEPPPEFLGVADTLRFQATLDPTTGMITCDHAGTNFDGDIRAEWHPDEPQEQSNDDEMGSRDNTRARPSDYGSSRQSRGPSRPRRGNPGAGRSGSGTLGAGAGQTAEPSQAASGSNSLRPAGPSESAQIATDAGGTAPPPSQTATETAAAATQPAAAADALDQSAEDTAADSGQSDDGATETASAGDFSGP